MLDDESPFGSFNPALDSSESTIASETSLAVYLALSDEVIVDERESNVDVVMEDAEPLKPEVKEEEEEKKEKEESNDEDFNEDLKAFCEAANIDTLSLFKVHIANEDVPVLLGAKKSDDILSENSKLLQQLQKIQYERFMSENPNIITPQEQTLGNFTTLMLQPNVWN